MKNMFAEGNPHFAIGIDRTQTNNTLVLLTRFILGLEGVGVDFAVRLLKILNIVENQFPFHFRVI